MATGTIINPTNESTIRAEAGHVIEIAGYKGGYVVTKAHGYTAEVGRNKGKAGWWVEAEGIVSTVQPGGTELSVGGTRRGFIQAGFDEADQFKPKAKGVVVIGRWLETGPDVSVFDALTEEQKSTLEDVVSDAYDTVSDGWIRDSQARALAKAAIEAYIKMTA